MNWYARIFDSEMGPIPFDDLRAMVEHGELGSDDKVRPEDQNEWLTAGEVPGLFFQLEAAAASSQVSDDRQAPQWFCEVLGTEFGPLTFDDLKAMADVRELSPNDRVRSGRDGAWQPARRIAGLDFPPPEPAVPQPTGTAVPTIDATTAKIDDADADDWFCRSLGTELGPLSFADLLAMVRHGELAGDDVIRQGPAGEWAAVDSVPELYAELVFAAPVSSAPAAAPVDRGTIPTNESVSEAEAKPTIYTVPEHAAAESTASDTDEQIAPESEVAPEEVAPSARADVAEVPAAEPEAPAIPIPATPPPTSTPAAPASAPMAPSVPPRRVSAPVKAPAMRGGPRLDLGPWVESAAQHWKVAAAVAFIAVVIGLLMLLPRGGDPQEFYDTYAAIWEEHKQLRSSGAAPAQWAELEAKTAEQLSPILEVLADTAGAHDRLRQHLLFAGRDYLPLVLKQARTEPNEMEELFEQHMESARRLLSGEGPPPPRPDEGNDDQPSAEDSGETG